ncbi:MAG: hypothetical protein NTX31_16325 [Burkholderiales bacterium]|nr:hypothetical protein [Burkholderiales bacterium]
MDGKNYPQGVNSGWHSTNYVQSESWQIRDIHEGIKEADAGEFATDKQVKAVFAKYGA